MLLGYLDEWALQVYDIQKYKFVHKIRFIISIGKNGGEMDDNIFKVAELIVDAFVPIAVVLMGYIVNKTLARQNEKSTYREILFIKRIEIYRQVAERLNRI